MFSLTRLRAPSSWRSLSTPGLLKTTPLSIPSRTSSSKQIPVMTILQSSRAYSSFHNPLTNVKTSQTSSLFPQLPVLSPVCKQNKPSITQMVRNISSLHREIQSSSSKLRHVSQPMINKVIHEAVRHMSRKSEPYIDGDFTKTHYDGWDNVSTLDKVKLVLKLAALVSVGLFLLYHIFSNLGLILKVVLVLWAARWICRKLIIFLARNNQSKLALALETWGASEKNSSSFWKLVNIIRPSNITSKLSRSFAPSNLDLDRRFELRDEVLPHVEADARMKALFGDFKLGSIGFDGMDGEAGGGGGAGADKDVSYHGWLKVPILPKQSQGSSSGWFGKLNAKEDNSAQGEPGASFWNEELGNVYIYYVKTALKDSIKMDGRVIHVDPWLFAMDGTTAPYHCVKVGVVTNQGSWTLFSENGTKWQPKNDSGEQLTQDKNDGQVYNEEGGRIIEAEYEEKKN